MPRSCWADFRSTNCKWFTQHYVKCQWISHGHIAYLLKHLLLGPWMIWHVVSLRQKKLIWLRKLEIVHWRLEQGASGKPGMFGKFEMPGDPVMVMLGIARSRSPAIKKFGTSHVSHDPKMIQYVGRKSPDTSLCNDCNLCLGQDRIKPGATKSSRMSAVIPILWCWFITCNWNAPHSSA